MLEEFLNVISSIIVLIGYLKYSEPPEFSEKLSTKVLL